MRNRRVPLALPVRSLGPNSTSALAEPVAHGEISRSLYDGLGGPSYLWRPGIRGVAFENMMILMALDTVLASITLCRQGPRPTVTVLTDFQLGQQDVLNRHAFQRLVSTRDMMALDACDVTVAAVVKAAVRQPTRRNLRRDNLKAGCRIVTAG